MQKILLVPTRVGRIQCHNVAKALDYIYIDTGALYRTIGLSAMRRNIEPVEDVYKRQGLV